MGTLRAKGQDTAVFIVNNGVLQDTITDITDSEFTFEFEIKEENYLGKTSPDFDEVYKGTGGKISYHFSDDAPFKLMQSVMDRAQRRTPGLRINIQTTINFPSGLKKRVLLPDCFFGPMPFNNGGRTEYLKGTLDFKLSQPKVI